MVIDCVQRDRSEREFRYGTGGMLAKRERSTEAPWVVGTLINDSAGVETCGSSWRARASLHFEEGLKIP